MKYLKYILGVAAVLVIVFLSLGLIRPQLSYDREVVVEKSVEESWAVIQDEEKLAEWLPGFEKIEHISGTPGTVGAVADVYFDMDGEAMAIRETITALAPNESISMLYESDFMDMYYKMTMKSVDGKTKITTSTTAKGNGAISKSMIVLIGSSIEAQEDINLAQLKKTIEQNTKDYFPVDQEMLEVEDIE